MKLETFFEKFDQFADAPDAATKMRELILESAIRGKLVPQNASDEPASVLLKRMASVQASPVRKQAALPPVGDDAYLQLPQGWAWTRLGYTGRIFNGDSVSESGKAELAKVEDGLPFIATKDVGYGRDALGYDNGLKVPLGDLRFKVARANAVLICAEGGSAGRKIGITDRDICFGNKLYANEVREGIQHRYVFYVYLTPTFFKEFTARMTGIIGGIARSEFLSLPIPLPPEEEQKRIVAKVDQLMALCDRLGAQQQERETRHTALARASLGRFADAPTPANLHFIFHPSYAILPTDLRKSILTLAVQGKLVPRDPNDESAATPSESESVFEIPTSWQWQPLGTLGLCRTGKTPPTADPTNYGAGFPFIGPGQITPGGNFKVSEKTITSKGLENSTEADASDILMVCIGGSIGKAAICREPLGFNQQINSVRLTRDLPEFVYLAVTAEYFQEQVLANASGSATPIINKGKWEQIPVPIPPLAEQRRIVAKVEQLMTLMDALEAQLAASRTTAANLLSALVAELTQPS